MTNFERKACHHTLYWIWEHFIHEKGYLW